MPNVGSVLKEEITRLARKEARAANASLVKSNTTLRSSVAALKKEISGLKAEQKRLTTALGKLAKTAGVEPPQEEFYMTSRNVRGLRHRLKLTQAEFASLVGVSAQSVFVWENKGGRLQFRQATKSALQEIQDIDAGAARERLATQTRKKRSNSGRRRPK